MSAAAAFGCRAIRATSSRAASLASAASNAQTSALPLKPTASFHTVARSLIPQIANRTLLPSAVLGSRHFANVRRSNTKTKKNVSRGPKSVRGIPSRSPRGSTSVKSAGEEETYPLNRSTEETQNFIARVTKALVSRRDEIVQDLGPSGKGYVVIDDLLGPVASISMRLEAQSYYNSGSMVTSQSTKWDDETQSVINYEKHNVLSTDLKGGKWYASKPILHEYAHAAVRGMHSIIEPAFPEALMGTDCATKLAVCVGEGSAYDRHIDNAGGVDIRKLTMVYYLNHGWKPEHGGEFQVYGKGNDAGANGDDVPVKLAPVADRLVIFWADELSHGVCQSYAPNPPEDYRWALTVWMLTKDVSAISNPNNSTESSVDA